MQNKPVAEHLPQVRIGNLKEQGLLDDVYWQDDYYAGSDDPFRMFGQVSNEFRYTMKAFGHRTFIELGWNIGDKRYLSKVKLVNDRLNFGGHRFWFVCPTCSSRCGVLYIIQHVCGCNKCLQIAYTSQNKTKNKPPTLEELSEERKRLTDVWLALWSKGRFFYDNRPTKDYLNYLIMAKEAWGVMFLNPEASVLMYQAHDTLLFKPPTVLINGK